jgi:hypothetical protein
MTKLTLKERLLASLGGCFIGAAGSAALMVILRAAAIPLMTIPICALIGGLFTYFMPKVAERFLAVVEALCHL